MSTNHSFAKRILALLLTLMMFIGMVPLSVSAAKSESPSVNNDSPATLDEVKPTDGEGDEDLEEQDYPQFQLNEKAVYYRQDNNSLLYVSGKNFSVFSIKMRPDDETYKAIAADLSNKNKEHFSVSLTKAEENDELNVEGFCAFKAEDGIVTVSLNMNKVRQFRDESNTIVLEGLYTLSVEFSIDDSQIQIGRYDFRVVNKSSVVYDVKYNRGEYCDWFRGSVDIEFKTNSEILKAVTVDNYTVTEENGIYSFTVSTNGKVPVIKTTDFLNNTVSTKLNQINIDNKAPSFGKPVFKDADGNEVTGWHNSTLSVEISVTDTQSGVDSSSIKVTNLDGDVDYHYDSESGILSFDATKRCDYNIECTDIVGNEAKKKIFANAIKIDNKKPVAEDFTLNFSSAADVSDSVFSFLSFGMYSNNDIAVEIDVNDHGQSEISKINFFNKVGEDYRELEKVDEKYILSAPDDEKGKAKFDLYVSAEDAAGNKSDLFRVVDSNVKTTLEDGIKEPLKDLSESLYEIVISKVVPSFDDEVRYRFPEDKITVVESDGESVKHIAGNGKIAFKAREEITGLAEVTVTLQREGSGEQTVFHESYKDEAEKRKWTENASFELKDLESGVYKLSFTSKANNGNKSPEKTETFVVDNDAPALTEKGFVFLSKDGVELKAEDWTKDDVKVSFELTDNTGIKSVKVKLGEEEIQLNDEGSGKYNFTAEKYGVYKVEVTDELGNTQTLETPAVKIDKAAPVVKDEAFSFSNADENGEQKWTNENVTVSFSALDLPEPEGEHSGLKELEVSLNGSAVTHHMDLETGECNFTAEKYGTYQVKLTDVLGNSSEEYEVGPILIDKDAPTVKGVNFSVFEESDDAKLKKRSYGVYANTALKMTVTVENTSEVEDCSPLTEDSVTVKDNDGSDVANIEFDSWGQESNNPAKYNYVFKINLEEEITADYIRNLIITATDTATDKDGKNPNTGSVKLGGDGESTIVITMDDAEAFDKALYDVIATTTTASVDPFEFSIDEGKRRDNVFRGYSVRIKTRVFDELVGIDKVTVEFGRADVGADKYEAELKNVSQKAVESFNPRKEKVNSVAIDYLANIRQSDRYIFRVTAYNNAGNKYTYAEDFYSDNIKPIVKEIQISGMSCNANENGIYLDGDEEAAITVIASDANGDLHTAGVKTIELSCGKPSEIVQNADGTASVKFTLEPGQKYENITYTITDAFGLQTKDGKLVNHRLTGDVDIQPSTDKYEIVVNNDSGKIQSEGFTFDFDYEDEDNLIFMGKEKGDVSIELSNDFSGIASAVLSVNGQVITAEEGLTESEEKDIYGKTIKKILTLDAKDRVSGKYEIKVEATDCAGIPKEFKETFYIDKTAPTVKSVNFKTNDPSIIDKFFNLISFGLFSSDDMLVEVTVEDLGPSVGIDGEQIALASTGGLEVNEGGTTETTEETEDGLKRTYVKSFTFKSSRKKEKSTSSYNDIKVTVTDKFDNTEGNKALENVQINGNTFVFDPEHFKFVASDKTPDISEIKANGAGKFKKSDNTVWFSGNPTFEFTVTDEISKLHAVKVELNGKDVTKRCSYNNNENNLPASFTDFKKHSGIEIEEAVISLNTKTSDLKADGEENVLTVTATGNNGVTSDPVSYSFFMDRSVPNIDNVTYNVNNNPIDKNIWVNTDVTVIFNITDLPESNNSGLKDSLKAIRTNDGSSYDISIENGVGQFVADKYGEYTIEAEDNVGNSKHYSFGTVLIDKTAPEISIVTFEAFDEGGTVETKPYGTYSHTKIKMTVTTVNPNGGEANWSELAAGEDGATVTVTNDNENSNLVPEFQQTDGDSNIFTIDVVNVDDFTVEDVYNLKFTISDTAGNVNVYILGENCELKVIGDGMDKTIYEVISSLATAQIDSFTVNFGEGNYKEGVYHGKKGTFKTKVTDSIIGIDSIKVEFGKIDMGYSRDLKTVALTDVTSVVLPDGIDSSTKKITEVPIQYEGITEESGRYVFRVTATNNAGNKNTETCEVLVDNVEPEIDSVEIIGNVVTVIPQDSDVKKGIYLNGEAQIKVTVVDTNNSMPSAGISKIKIECEGFEAEESAVEGYASFNLPDDKAIRDLKITVWDAFDISMEDDLVNYKIKIKDGETEIAPDQDNFEIVVNNDSEKIQSEEGFTYDFNYEDEDNLIFRGVDKGDVSIELTNDFSGIYSTVFEVNAEKKLTESEETDSYGKIIKKTLTLDAKDYLSGTYEVSVKVTDYCGVTNEFKETFYIDKTAPMVESINFKTNENNIIEQFFNFITFGLYSKDDIAVEVTVEDSVPSAGIDGDKILLSSASGLEVTADGTTETTETKETETAGIDKPRTYVKRFTFKSSDEKATSNYNDFVVSVTDKFDNSVGQNPDTFKVDGETFVFDEGFDIVASGNAPVVSGFTGSGEGKYDRISDTTEWFKSNPVITFNVKDDISKLHTIEVNLNGQSVTNICTYDNGKSLSDALPFTHFDSHTGTKIENVVISLNTANLTLNDDGKENVLTVTATGNNGVTSEPASYSFYIDSYNPYITKFSFQPIEGGNIDGDGSAIGPDAFATTYGYYFQKETKVTVEASDFNKITKSEGVGVSRIGFRTVDINGTETDYGTKEPSNAEFTISANFKGHFYAYAYDFVNNNIEKKDEYSPENVIVEDHSHDSDRTIQFSHPNAAHKDANNLDLYDNSVNVDVEIGSTYAGIREIEINVKAPYDTGNNYTVMSKVNHDGVISDSEMTGSGTVGSWGIISTEANLVTRVKRTITIANNSNDIEISAKVTDNAGYSTESEKLKFSIDKTNPVLDVSFDESDGNPIGDRRYFNKAKTATVTVKERNFNSKDYSETVKRQLLNSNYTAPSIGAWSVTPNTSDPDNTVHTATITFNEDGDYSFSCSCVDLVGRKSETKTIKDFTVDKTKPVIDDISLTFDSGDKGSGIYHSTKATAVITIHDVNFYDNASYVKADISALKQDHNGAAGSSAYSETGWNVSGDKITKTINFNDDGDYAIKVTCTDKARNEQQAPKEQSTFIIDQKYERCEIKNVDNKQAYKEKVEPVIEAFDYNYDNVVYHLYRYGETGSDDQDGNTKDDKETAGWVDVTNEMTHNDDENKASGNLKVSFSNFESINDNDGIYKIEATGTDKAKNTKKDEKLFSVSRFGANFMLDEETEKLTSVVKYTNNVENPVVIKEINVVDLKESVVQVNRESSTTTLKEGEDYRVHKTHKDNEWYEFTFEIEPEQFTEEGRYEITITSKDALDRTVSNRTIKNGADKDNNVIERDCPCSFVVDKTLPIVTIAGIEQNQYYSEAEREVVVTCEDANLDSESLKVEFDGKLLTDNDYQMTEDANMIELRLKLEADGNTDDRSFKVSIADKAGNENKDGEIAPFRLSATWLARLLHDHLPLVIILGSLLLLAIAFVVFMIVRKNNKKKNG